MSWSSYILSVVPKDKFLGVGGLDQRVYIPSVILIAILFIVNQRERERRNSDRSEDGYHSDGDYGEHDYRHDISDERESKTIMLRGLPITITESDVRK